MLAVILLVLFTDPQSLHGVSIQPQRFYHLYKRLFLLQQLLSAAEDMYVRVWRLSCTTPQVRSCFAVVKMWNLVAAALRSVMYVGLCLSEHCSCAHISGVSGLRAVYIVHWL